MVIRKHVKMGEKKFNVGEAASVEAWKLAAACRCR
jgi:hypothetical protein